MKKNNKAGNNVGDINSHKVTKKHRTTKTQRASFKQLNESGKRETQKLKVYAFMVGKPPLTSRQLSAMTGHERTAVTRIINDLKEAGRVRVAFSAKCQTTGITVEHYAVITIQPTLFDGMEGAA